MRPIICIGHSIENNLAGPYILTILLFMALLQNMCPSANMRYICAAHMWMLYWPDHTLSSIWYWGPSDKLCPFWLQHTLCHMLTPVSPANVLATYLLPPIHRHADANAMEVAHRNTSHWWTESKYLSYLNGPVSPVADFIALNILSWCVATVQNPAHLVAFSPPPFPIPSPLPNLPFILPKTPWWTLHGWVVVVVDVDENWEATPKSHDHP